jgi:SpoVK/Ycf46/Vps4 family AAA+-type ATPase
LLQFDGVGSGDDSGILIMGVYSLLMISGATNRPGDLDQAALRRLVKRVYIPLPDDATRRAFLVKVLSDEDLSGKEMDKIVKKTDGYSGSDLVALSREASLGPVRGVDILTVKASDIRKISSDDFMDALR